MSSSSLLTISSTWLICQAEAPCGMLELRHWAWPVFWPHGHASPVAPAHRSSRLWEPDRVSRQWSSSSATHSSAPWPSTATPAGSAQAVNTASMIFRHGCTASQRATWFAGLAGRTSLADTHPTALYLPADDHPRIADRGEGPQPGQGAGDRQGRGVDVDAACCRTLLSDRACRVLGGRHAGTLRMAGRCDVRVRAGA